MSDDKAIAASPTGSRSCPDGRCRFDSDLRLTAEPGLARSAGSRSGAVSGAGVGKPDYRWSPGTGEPQFPI